MTEYPKAIGPLRNILALDAEDEARKLAALYPVVEDPIEDPVVADTVPDDAPGLGDVEEPPKRRGRPRKEDA